MQKVESLTAKVRILEERFTSYVPEEGDTPLSMHTTCSNPNSERKSYAEMMSQSEKVLNLVEKLTVTISNQERIIDKERREKNIIMGKELIDLCIASKLLMED